MGNHSRGYINRCGRESGETNYQTRLQQVKDIERITELTPDGLPVTLRPERVQTKITGPVALVMKLIYFLASRKIDESGRSS